MNRDDYYNMAVASGLWQSKPIYDTAPMAVSLMRFVEMVAAVEREACAKVCDEIEEQCYKRNLGRWPENRNSDEDGAANCATAIRARGEKP